MGAIEQQARVFTKKCSLCGSLWASREAFLSDPEVELIGYQPNFKALHLGLLLFNHSVCHTTFAVYADVFVDLYNGPIFAERRIGEEDCQGHCLRGDVVEICQAKCECAFIREICHIVHNWPKQSAA